MYDTTDVNHSGWDGTIRGTDASPDSYGWYLEVTCEGNYKKEFKGNVTLLR